MAHHHAAYPRASLAKQLANFTNTSAGLDLTLRLIQALALVAAQARLDDATVKGCSMATSQLALARRYLRFFSFIECFQGAYGLLADDSLARGAMTTLELVQSSCLGLYFLLEDLTMLHDMNIWLVPWYMPVLLEANKFWFYAICASITRAVGELFFGSAAKSKAREDHPDVGQKKAESEKDYSSKPASSTISLLKRIVIDVCDLALPMSFLEWIALGDLGVGAAMVVSTVLVWPDLWASVQR